MKFLSKILPLILLTLLIALIYYGGNRMIQYVNDNPEAYQAYLVTKKKKEAIENGTYDSEAAFEAAVGNNVASESDFDETIDNDEILEEEDFEDNLADVKMHNPEATLDAELEGKSSNQLLGSKKKKETKSIASKSSATKKSAVSKSKTSSTTKGVVDGGKSKSNLQGIAAAKRANEKPAQDNLTTKGRTPTAYGAYADKQFKVIAGSFKSKENANTFIDDLEKKGLKNLEIIEIPGKNLNRVVVSRHPTYNAAKKAINELKQYYNVDSYVHVPAN